MSRKGMAGMIRLHKWQLDEKRRNMVELEKMKEELVRGMDNLHQELATEQKKAAESSVISITYGSYAKQVIARRENFENSIAEVETSLEDMKDQVAEAYKELKKFEVVEQRDRDRELADFKRRQQNDLDELAINIHRKQHKLG